MSTLESYKAQISALFELIAKDQRHTKIKEIYFRPAKYRLFKKWHMRLVDLDIEQAKNLSGIRDILLNMDENGKVNNITAPVLILKEFAHMS